MAPAGASAIDRATAATARVTWDIIIVLSDHSDGTTIRPSGCAKDAVAPGNTPWSGPKAETDGRKDAVAPNK